MAVLVAICGSVFATLAVPGMAGARVQPYGTNDFAGFRNVLPPGTNGLVNAAQLGLYELTKARPPHNDDQLAMCSNLTTAAPGIQPAQIGNYFQDATFGVPPGNVGLSESPSPASRSSATSSSASRTSTATPGRR